MLEYGINFKFLCCKVDIVMYYVKIGGKNIFRYYDLVFDVESEVKFIIM